MLCISASCDCSKLGLGATLSDLHDSFLDPIVNSVLGFIFAFLELIHSDCLFGSDLHCTKDAFFCYP